MTDMVAVELRFRPVAKGPVKCLHVRMSEELHGRLHASAKQNGRSLNSEIVARLEHSLISEQIAIKTLVS